MLSSTLLVHLLGLFALTTNALASSPLVLVYYATAGYYHDSIPTGLRVLGEQGPLYGISFDFTEDKTQFRPEILTKYDAVLFFDNTDQVLDETGEAALKAYFEEGGNFVGIHAASSCEWDDRRFSLAIGALFDYHPTLQNVTYVNLDSNFPATKYLPTKFRYEEEAYHFQSDPRENGAVVVLALDPDSFYNDGTSSGNYSGGGHPLPAAWYNESPLSAKPLAQGAPVSGRSFYTALGHSNRTWESPWYQGHVMEGIKWVLDGNSTLAYGVGLVGNPIGTATASSSGASVSSTQFSARDAGALVATSSTSASTGTNTDTSTSTGTSYSSAATSSSAAMGKSAVLGGAGAGIIGTVLAGIVAGVGLAW
ncbi:trehalose utilization-domain-containing protein [Naematelia encephala]|uniref:Trehalose utilization-domain-containing protein n=1 Tax=Naematelia encephala TaxID=71784 RepID=A0A1Y2BF30_9TREE|nr:trehalose utilization-domain-containing protein [Naematelia encephala]